MLARFALQYITLLYMMAVINENSASILARSLDPDTTRN
jgi:hypothetical protein